MPAKILKPLPRNTREPVIFVFGAIVREQREKRGWLPEELAKRSGLRRQGINAIESNGSLARGESIARIGRAFGIPGSVLLAMSEERVLQYPMECADCNYCCFADGKLRWLNPTRGCRRPAR